MFFPSVLRHYLLKERQDANSLKVRFGRQRGRLAAPRNYSGNGCGWPQRIEPGELNRLLGDLQMRFEPGAAQFRISLTETRDCGMVIGAGLAGADAQLDAGNVQKDRAAVHAAVELTTAAEFSDVVQEDDRLSTTSAVGGGRAASDLFRALARFGEIFCAKSFRAGAYALHELRLDFADVGGQLTVCAAHCYFGTPPATRVSRPIEKIDKLISSGQHRRLLGVSAGNMNFGRIILRNLIGSVTQGARDGSSAPGKRKSTACVAPPA